MRLKVQHGRVGSTTEYYEWRIVKPRVVVQKYGRRWFLGITHTDGTWQIPLYLDSLEDAKLQGRRLALRYATDEHTTVEEDVQLAKTFVEELLAARAGEGLTEIVMATAPGETFVPYQSL